MYKYINLELNPQDEFFTYLKDELSIQKEFIGGHQIGQYNDLVVKSTIKILINVAKSQGQFISGLVKIGFEKDELKFPEFYNALVDEIKYASDYYIEARFAKKYADFVVGVLHEVANKQLQEKKIKVPELVDPNKELETITKYMVKTWDGFDKVNAEAFFTQIWNICLEKTKDKYEQYTFTEVVRQWSEERADYNNWKNAGTTISEKEFKEKVKEDVLQKFPVLILLENMKFSSEINKNWDYEKVANGITAQIKKEFPDASKLKPKGWKEFKKNYSDFAGQAEFDSKAAKKEFGGMHSGTACSHPFEVRVALPYVMYDDINHGRKPLNVLVSAILTHAYILNEKNNAASMLKELVELKAKYDQSEYYKEPVKNISFDFKVPLNKKLFTMMHNSNPDIFTNSFSEEIDKKKAKP